jgi:thiamine biosynthesis lipoprotein
MEIQQLNLFGMMKVTVRILFTFVLLSSCSTDVKKQTTPKSPFNQRITGKTQGTTYEIKFVNKNTSISKRHIDSILHDFDLELSGYIDNSLLSKINKDEISALPKESIYFRECFLKSQQISILSNGAFDPTVFTLVKAWGFFSKPYKVPSDSLVNKLLIDVGFENLLLRNDSIIKLNKATTIDFNAIAQGYSVDVIGTYLTSMGHQDFYVEIGGEVLVNGKKNDNEPWYLAIDYPSKSNKEGEGRMAKAVIAIDQNKAIATSGNYRKVFEYNGKEYGHSLDPKTGRPAENNTRSVTVIANNCMEADAYATAFMILGVEASLEFLKKNDSLGLDVYFLYKAENGLNELMTESFKSYMP